MHRLLLPALALSLTSCASWQSPIPHGAKATDHGLIGAGEGPAWKDGSLYFTDGKHINRYTPPSRVGSIFVSGGKPVKNSPAPGGTPLVHNGGGFPWPVIDWTNAAKHTKVFRDEASAHNANGLMFDRESRLIACESGARRVTRTERNGSITVLASHYHGKRFNTPNDLAADSKGRIYFTDPRYGNRDGMEILEADGKAVEGVYRIDAPGKVTRIEVPGIERPNGIVIGPNDRYLYICDNNNNTHGGARKLVRFKLDASGLVKPGSRKVLFDWKGSRGPDGMKMDTVGRLYVAGGVNQSNLYETDEFKAGCYILSPGGRLLEFIPTAPDEACNCAIGGWVENRLFITSGNHLWSVPVGAKPFSPFARLESLWDGYEDPSPEPDSETRMTQPVPR